MEGGEQLGLTLTPTSKSRDFDTTFTEVSHTCSLGLINDEQLRLFHLAIESNRFSHRDLTRYLRSNIGRYVFSRADLAEYRRDENLELVVYDAVGRILAQDESQQGLGELMLYILLEQVLGAPKVLSKIELNRQSGQARSQCDAIHLYTPEGTNPVRSMVFGTSSVTGDIQDAIDAAFDKIVRIEQNSNVELQLAENHVFTETLDEDSVHRIKELLIPKKGGATIYDRAYSLFLGYDLGLDPNAHSSSDYRARLDAKMQLDLKQHATDIANKIKTHNLDRYSFYVYALPFDDILNDAAAIMDAVLNREGRGHA